MQALQTLKPTNQTLTITGAIQEDLLIKEVKKEIEKEKTKKKKN